MNYHAIFHPQDTLCVIRPSNHGISALEWEHGCRVLIQVDTIPLSKFKTLIEDDLGYIIATEEEWSDYICSLDDPRNVPNNNFKSSRVVIDKWDGGRPIY